jgi:hypothetical protein
MHLAGQAPHRCLPLSSNVRAHHMAHISTATRRRLDRLARRHERIVRTPSYRGHRFLYEFDASLRLIGVGEHHDAITQKTGLTPAHVHRKGEQRSTRAVGKPWQEDMWLLQSPLGPDASLDDHLGWLWGAIEPHRDYFRELIEQCSTADIIFGCLSESPYPFLTVDADSLRLLREMKLGISFNFTYV